MLEPTSTSSFISPDARTISVDVVSMLGSSSTTITENTDIFYESEVLAIVHRCKTPSSGLVDTFVWAWIGKRSQYGKDEEKKVYEMARRYGTTPVSIPLTVAIVQLLILYFRLSCVSAASHRIS
jgi:hypothetical protein